MAEAQNLRAYLERPSRNSRSKLPRNEEGPGSSPVSLRDAQGSLSAGGFAFLLVNKECDILKLETFSLLWYPAPWHWALHIMGTQIMFVTQTKPAWRSSSQKRCQLPNLQKGFLEEQHFTK